MFTKKYLKDVAERAIRTALQAYFSAWVVTGGGFDDLYSGDTLRFTVIAVAASIAMALGLKNVGSKNSASILTQEAD